MEQLNISTIRTDNAAFEKYPEAELARILRKLADRIEAGKTNGLLWDANGNSVADWEIT